MLIISATSIILIRDKVSGGVSSKVRHDFLLAPSSSSSLSSYHHFCHHDDRLYPPGDHKGEVGPEAEPALVCRRKPSLMFFLRSSDVAMARGGMVMGTKALAEALLLDCAVIFCSRETLVSCWCWVPWIWIISSYSIRHTDRYRHTHAQTHTYTHMCMRKHPHIHTYTLTQTDTHTHTHINTHTHTHTLIHTHTLKHTHTNMHPLLPPLSHSHPHTNTEQQQPPRRTSIATAVSCALCAMEDWEEVMEMRSVEPFSCCSLMELSRYSLIFWSLARSAAVSPLWDTHNLLFRLG